MAYWWADWNARKLARHRVTPDEAEEAMEDPEAVPAFAYPGEDGWPREAVVGMTTSGRLLVVVWEMRPDAAAPTAEEWTVVITAFPPDAATRRRYGRQ